MPNRLPTNRTIRITVDSQHNFHYEEIFSGNDASILTAINDDRITWVLDSAIEPRTFQLDFDVINPFHIFRKVTLRGKDHIVSERVRFPDGYTGNRTLKYTVSLANGLQDDPDVVPVPADAGTLIDPLILILMPDCDITWADNTYADIQLNPAQIVKSAGDGRATVTWQWSVGSNDPTPPFHLHFEPPVPAGCQAETDSTNGMITLTPSASPMTQFTISTTKGDGSGAIKKDGDLTIT